MQFGSINGKNINLPFLLPVPLSSEIFPPFNGVPLPPSLIRKYFNLQNKITQSRKKYLKFR